jgi:hypothetical protein
VALSFGAKLLGELGSGGSGLPLVGQLDLVWGNAKPWPFNVGEVVAIWWACAGQSQIHYWTRLCEIEPTPNSGIVAHCCAIEPVISSTAWMLDLVRFGNVEEQHFVHVALSRVTKAGFAVDGGIVPTVQCCFTLPDGEPTLVRHGEELENAPKQ